MSSRETSKSATPSGASTGLSSATAPATSSNEPQQQQQNGPSSLGTNGEDKARLTEEEKKQNHIASEQKRRQAIRDGFDRLTELVPGLEGQGRSEGLVLNRTVEFMREQIAERRRLIREIEAKGGHVDDKMRI